MSDLMEVPVRKQGDKSEDALLNTAISVAVALAGTFMALSNVKDGNVNQAMQDAQARKINAWSYYQAKSTKQNLAEGTLEQLRSLRALSASATQEVLGDLDRKIADFLQKVAKYESEKAVIKTEAESWQTKYEALNKTDDQLDLSDAALSVGIALSGVAALVQRRALFVVSLLFIGFGMVMGMAAFLGLPLEVPFLSQWLS
jgi:hypothetical protein